MQENKDFHYWNVDFHSVYWRAQSHGISIERVPVRLPSKPYPSIKVLRIMAGSANNMI